MQPFQIPAILLVEKLRLRKLLVTLTWYPAQAVWLLMGLIPLVVDVPSGMAVSALLGLMAFRGFLIAIMSTGWNSWMRDLVPRSSMGRFFSRRLAYSTGASIVFGLAGGAFIDFWKSVSTADNEVLGFSFVLVFGYLSLGLMSCLFVSMMPEPRMPPELASRPSIPRMLAAPLRDSNYKHLVRFLFFWHFVSYLAIPFFPVYMLVVLELPLSAVIGFTVLSQVVYVVFLGIWGPLADKYGYKVTLSLAASLYVLVILGWAFTTLPDRYFMTFPLLTLLFIFWGVASAGTNLAVDTFGLKLAPQGQAISYLVAASLATSLGAGLGPLVGGRFVDFFSVRELAFNISWISPSQNVNLPALHLTGYDFLFAISFLLGLLALNTLHALREEGEVSREVVLDEIVSATRQMARPLGPVPGLGMVATLPYHYLRHIPGVDVAVSMTAYEIVSATRAAVSAVAHGGATAADIAEKVGHTVSEMAHRIHIHRPHGVQLARDATKGAMHAVEGSDASLREVADGAFRGVISGLHKAGLLEAEKALREVGYGAVQGTSEAGLDIEEAAWQVVQSARSAAKGIGISEEEAASHVALGAMEAAESLGAEAVMEVKSALLNQPLARRRTPSGEEEKLVERVGDA